ncbi:hypothetical protein D1007_32281 [Hordeum vulgare]|nr:hypothetical protein D1007_32281 [Hordeum vulgare]
MVSEADHAARQQSWYNRRNASRRFAFAKTEVALKWVRNDLDFTDARVLDRSLTTTETDSRHRHRFDDELAKIAEGWSLSDCYANAGRGKFVAKVPSVLSAV